MRRSRWLAPWKDSLEKPASCHRISRVVDRRFVLGDQERETSRKFMRMQENLSGCRLLSYCLMSNHFHLLLEVPPMPEGGISGEAIGGASNGHGRKNREVLVRACLSHRGAGFEPEKWNDAARIDRQMLGLALERKGAEADLTAAKQVLKAKVKGELEAAPQDNGTVLPELSMGAMLRCKVRYLSDGAVIGSKTFVNEAFSASRQRFGARRKGGARIMRGNAAPAAPTLWSMRDLQVGIT